MTTLAELKTKIRQNAAREKMRELIAKGTWTKQRAAMQTAKITGETEEFVLAAYNTK